MTISNIRDTDLLALSHHAERLHDRAFVAYSLKPFSTEASDFNVTEALVLADEITAAADRIRERRAAEAVSTNIRIGEEL